MTNSDSGSVSEAGSLAKPARLLEDKTSFSVRTILGNGNADELQSQCLPVDVRLQFCLVLIAHFSVHSPIHAHTA